MDASIAARIVSEKCGIPTMQLQHSIFLKIKSLLMEPEQACELMIQRWNEYLVARPRLTYKFNSAANFFHSVDWNNPAEWPYIRATPQQVGISRWTGPTMSDDEANVWRAKNGLPPL